MAVKPFKRLCKLGIYAKILPPRQAPCFRWSPDSSVCFFSDLMTAGYLYLPNRWHRSSMDLVETTRYPKVGDPNPNEGGYFEPEGTNIVWAAFNDNENQFWSALLEPDGSSLLVQWMNRLQNISYIRVIILRCQNKFYNEKQKAGWTWMTRRSLTFLKQNGGFILKSDVTGWNHYIFMT